LKNSAIYLTILFTFLLFSRPIRAEKTAPMAHKGIIDLQGWDFAKDGPLSLNGEWSFYWNQHINPNSPDKKKNERFLNQPQPWTNSKDSNGISYPAQGYATLRLRICHRKKEDSLALSVRGIILAYSVWCDGVKICQHGNPTTSPANYKGRMDRRIIPLPYKSDTTEVIFHVSNYFNSHIGGFYDKIELDLAERAELNNNLYNSILMVCFGALLFMSVFHFILYFFIQKEKTNLHFSVITLLVSLMALFNTDLMMHYLCTKFSPEIFLKSNYILFLTVIPFFAYHQILFPSEIKKNHLTIVKWIFSILVLILLITPTGTIAQYTLYTALVVTGISILFVTVGVVVSNYRKRLYSKPILAALLPLSFIVCNDVLFFTNIIHTGFFSPVGFLLYMIIQSIIITNKLGHSYKKEMRLKIKLEKLNQTLETKVTERTKELEEAMKTHAEAEESRRGLIHMVAHDIKNSLQAVLFLSVKKEVLYAGEKMMQLVQNMLDIERFEQAKMPVNPGPLTIKSLISSSTSQTRYLIDTKQINISARYPKDLSIEVDHNLLERVFINLLNNAIHHSKQNGKISIDIEYSEKRSHILISDEGSGIPEEYLEKVFDKYHSVGKSKYKYSTGLGLAFCKQAIEAHNGSIKAFNNKNNGATFEIILPHKEDFTFTEYETNTISCEKEILFSQEEANLLSFYILELRQADFYESSDLIKIIDSIPENSSTQISDWKNRIRKTVFTGNKEVFDNMIEGI